MSKRPFVSRFIDRGNQLLVRFNNRKQAAPSYAIPAAALANTLTLEPGQFSAHGYQVEASEGTLLVPERQQKVDSRLLSLPVIVTNAEIDEPGLPVYWCTTGPGSSNMGVAPPEWLLRRHPVVILGYRGVDGSTRLTSPEIVRAQKGLGHDLHGSASLAQFRQAVSTATNRWQAEGIDLEAYGLAQNAADLEVLRKALGHKRILLLGEGFGCRVVEQYAARYPEAVSRIVLMGPTAPGTLTWQPTDIDKLLERYATLYERSAGSKVDLAEMMKRALTDMPKSWGLFPIDPGKVRFMAFSLLFDRKNAALMIDTLKAAANGDPSGLAMMTILYDVVINSSARGAVGDLLVKSYRDEPLTSTELGEFGLGSPLSTLLEAGRTNWPLGVEQSLAVIEADTLLVSGNLDVAAPAGPLANSLLPKLANHHHVVLRDAGHLNDLWRLQPDAIEQLLNGFLSSGTIDESALKYEPIEFTVSQNLAAMMKLLWRVLLLLLGSAIACAILVALWRFF